MTERKYESMWTSNGREVKLPWVTEDVWLKVDDLVCGNCPATTIRTLINYLWRHVPETRKIPINILEGFAKDLGYTDVDMRKTMNTIKDSWTKKDKKVSFALGENKFFNGRHGELISLNKFTINGRPLKNEVFYVLQDGLDQFYNNPTVTSNFEVKQMEVDYYEFPDNIIVVVNIREYYRKLNPSISLNEALRVQKRYRELQNMDMTNLDFVLDGIKLDVSQQEIEEWKYTGLGTVDYIEMVLKPKYIDKIEEKKEDTKE